MFNVPNKTYITATKNPIIFPESDYNGQEATEQWYSEIQYFNWNNCSTFNPKTGHFTQVVWKSSQKIGAAISTSPSGKKREAPERSQN